MVGFPHSEILGSKLIRSSPRLIAAYYVLHRLHAPRHPLDALKALDRSHYRCPQLTMASCNRHGASRTGTKLTTPLRARSFLIGQIKLTRIHVALLLSPGCGSNKQKSHLFTMSKDPVLWPPGDQKTKLALCVRRYVLIRGSIGAGGARRDRTDDLMLAKHALSQLSYGPNPWKIDHGKMVGPAPALSAADAIGKDTQTETCTGPPRM